ncbi:MAG TPA: hypothetical protein VIJ25_15160 [Methylococcales bacterium]
MIAATLLAIYLLFFSAGHEQLGTLMENYVKDQIKAVIADEGRRKLALEGLSVVNDDIADLNKSVAKSNKQLESLIKDYNSKAEEFDQLFSSVQERRNQQVGKLWDDRQAMLTHIKADEWQTIISSAKAKEEEKAKHK